MLKKQIFLPIRNGMGVVSMDKSLRSGRKADSIGTARESPFTIFTPTNLTT